MRDVLGYILTLVIAILIAAGSAWLYGNPDLSPLPWLHTTP